MRQLAIFPEASRRGLAPSDRLSLTPGHRNQEALGAHMTFRDDDSHLRRNKVPKTAGLAATWR